MKALLYFALWVLVVSTGAKGYSIKIPTISSKTKWKTLEAFHEQRNAFKVIAGLHNFDAQYVSRIAKVARNAGASHLDIACSPELVKMTKNLFMDDSTIAICVSGIDPESFAPAIDAGADMIEIGNFDGFYSQGKVFSAKDVLGLTIATRKLYPDVALSVTIPHTLSIHEQMSLAQELEKCGVDLIQTEGRTLSPALSGHVDIQESIQRAATTLASTFAIAKSVAIPVMCASGLDETSAAISLKLGAKGVGVGRHITKHDPDEAKMETVARTIATAMNRQPTSANMLLASTVINKLIAVSDVPCKALFKA